MMQRNAKTTPPHINGLIRKVLREDRTAQDVTTNILIPKNQISRAVIVFKEDAVVCGLDIARKVFRYLDKNIKFSSKFRDGANVKKDSQVVFIKGKTRALLKGERVALNFLSHLSGIATKTREFVKKIRPFKTEILDTRKTTPGLRKLEKYAVVCAGGINHRDNLNEMVLIKDNHRTACRSRKSLSKMIQSVKKSTKKLIEVEVETLAEFKEALAQGPDIILLDNMSIAQIKKAVDLVKRRKRRPLLEASGGINLKNVRALAKTGVDRISVGELTHSVRSINISMELVSNL